MSVLQVAVYFALERMKKKKKRRKMMLARWNRVTQNYCKTCGQAYKKEDCHTKHEGGRILCPEGHRVCTRRQNSKTYEEDVELWRLEDRTPRPIKKTLSFREIKLKQRKCNNNLVINGGSGCPYWRFSFCNFDEYGCFLTKIKEVEA